MFISRGRQPPGDKVLMSADMSCHFIHLLQVLKKSLWSLILYIFSWFNTCSPGAGAERPQGTKFWCQQKGLITFPICCKFQRNPLEVWFYTIVFMIKYMYIAPGQGTKFWCQKKGLITLPICCTFQRNLFGLILYNFGHDLVHAYSPRD